MPEIKIIIAICSLFAFGCGPSLKEDPLANAENLHAEFFQLSKTEDGTLAEVYIEPLDQTFSYLLQEGGQYSASDSKTPMIKVPVERAICLSTTFLYPFEVFGETDRICGVANMKDVYSEEIWMRYEAGEIRNIGYNISENLEAIIAAEPDVVFVNASAEMINKYPEILDELDIPVVYVAEFLEKSPLAKAEWIRFLGSFLGKEQEAQEVITKVDSNYNRLREKVDPQESPTVFFDLPYKGSWYIPGGKSFQAQMVADAGGQYLWADDTHHGGVQVSRESVFGKALDASYWLNPSYARTKEEILGIESEASKFMAFQNDAIYSNLKRTNEWGGNDYWESGVYRPDRILNDLILILHGHEVNAEELYYYEQVK